MRRRRPGRRIERLIDCPATPAACCAAQTACEAKYSRRLVDYLRKRGACHEGPNVSDTEINRVSDPLTIDFSYVPLFAGVDIRSVHEILAECGEVLVDAGDVVLEAGADNETVFVVLDGSVLVHLGQEPTSPALELGRGECVGELSILNRLQVSARVAAQVRTRLLVLPAEQLWSLVNNSHEFACNLLRVLSGRVRDANQRLLASVIVQERFARASRIDALTGLYNRRWLDEILTRQCRRCSGDGTSLCLILCDIDHFKQINDEYGHIVGDDVLRAVGECLNNSVRPTDLAARFGGEEFAILLHDIELLGAAEIAERIRRDIEMLMVPGDGRLGSISASFGVAELAASDDPMGLLNDADRALYHAKRYGRNRVVSFPESTALAAL